MIHVVVHLVLYDIMSGIAVVKQETAVCCMHCWRIHQFQIFSVNQLFLQWLYIFCWKLFFLTSKHISLWQQILF